MCWLAGTLPFKIAGIVSCGIKTKHRWFTRQVAIKWTTGIGAYLFNSHKQVLSNNKQSLQFAGLSNRNSILFAIFTEIVPRLHFSFPTYRR